MDSTLRKTCIQDKGTSVPFHVQEEKELEIMDRMIEHDLLTLKTWI